MCTVSFLMELPVTQWKVINPFSTLKNSTVWFLTEQPATQSAADEPSLALYYSTAWFLTAAQREVKYFVFTRKDRTISFHIVLPATQRWKNYASLTRNSSSHMVIVYSYNISVAHTVFYMIELMAGKADEPLSLRKHPTHLSLTRFYDSSATHCPRRHLSLNRVSTPIRVRVRDSFSSYKGSISRLFKPPSHYEDQSTTPLS